MFRRCSALVASVPKFGTHMSGSAIDISVMHLDDPSREVDRGAPYLEMSALTPMGSPFVSDAARRNRREITALMRRHGFVDYPWEFWHYSSGDAYEQVLLQDRPAGDLRRGAMGPGDEPGHAAAAARAAAEQLRRDPRRDRRRAGAAGAAQESTHDPRHEPLHHHRRGPREDAGLLLRPARPERRPASRPGLPGRAGSMPAASRRCCTSTGTGRCRPRAPASSTTWPSAPGA